VEFSSTVFEPEAQTVEIKWTTGKFAWKATSGLIIAFLVLGLALLRFAARWDLKDKGFSFGAAFLAASILGSIIVAWLYSHEALQLHFQPTEIRASLGFGKTLVLPWADVELFEFDSATSSFSLKVKGRKYGWTHRLPRNLGVTLEQWYRSGRGGLPRP